MVGAPAGGACVGHGQGSGTRPLAPWWRRALLLSRAQDSSAQGGGCVLLGGTPPPDVIVPPVTISFTRNKGPARRLCDLFPPKPVGPSSFWGVILLGRWPGPGPPLLLCHVPGKRSGVPRPRIAGVLSIRAVLPLNVNLASTDLIWDKLSALAFLWDRQWRLPLGPCHLRRAIAAGFSALSRSQVEGEHGGEGGTHPRAGPRAVGWRAGVFLGTGWEHAFCTFR